MRILLTGAAGFLGYHVAEHLLARGDEIVGLDNFDDAAGAARKERNVADLQRWPGWWLVRGDVRDRALVRRLCAKDGIEAVVHLAARCRPEEARREPERHADVNVTGTATVLEAALRGAVRSFVLASSAEVHGAADPPQGSGSPADSPLSVHAATRRGAELLAQALAARGRMATTVLRLFSPYGPRQRSDDFVQSCLAALDEGRPVPRPGDGSRVCDFVHAEDVAAAFRAALDHCAGRSRGHRVHAVGRGRGTSLNELIETAGRVVGREPEVEESRAHGGESPALVADADESRRELGWQASVELEDGLRSQLAWLREGRSSHPTEPAAAGRSREERP